MSPPKGHTAYPQKVHIVAYVGCGCRLERKTHWRKPKCEPCQKRDWRKVAEGRHGRRLEEARRYRRIMHIAGFSDAEFEEFLVELKASPLAYREQPEGRLALFDETVAKRKRKQERLQAERRSTRGREAA